MPWSDNHGEPWGLIPTIGYWGQKRVGNNMVDMTADENAEEESNAITRALENGLMRPKAQVDHTTAQADLEFIPDAPNPVN